jgi:type IV secretory pathway VirD2 relaxase
MGVGGAKAAALHLRYIERDGVEKDGSKGRLYTADGPARIEGLNEPRRGERHQFRLIVSPEDAGELDLTDYVRRLMAEVEKDVGRKLEWAAVNHYDTGHPHAHVVVRGVDREGREVRLDRGYISQGLRWRAQELATEELGPRLAIDVHRAQAREISQDRVTSLDRELERRAHDGRVEARWHARAGRIDESTLLARLEHLEGLRLADRCGPTSWNLVPGWQDELRELGARGDVLKQIHKAIVCDPVHYRVVRQGEPLDADRGAEGKVRVGRVASKGLSDELKGTFYAVLETTNGLAYHVPLDAKTAEVVRPGDVVLFGSRPEPAVRPVDRHIAEIARGAGGVFALDPAVDQGQRARAAGRLRDLERVGLVARLAPDQWTVPGDLIEKLEIRARAEAPKARLMVQKLPLSLDATPGHRGPVWLDEVEGATLAHWGFGADVRRALDRRRDVLRALGIDREDPRRDAKLREVERRAVGEGMAARTRQEFLAKTPDRFRGRLQAGPEGGGYAVVTDGTRFVVVPASRELRTLVGSTVAVVRDAEGRLTIRAFDRDRDR